MLPLAALVLALCCVPGLCQQQVQQEMLHQQEVPHQGARDPDSRRDSSSVNRPFFNTRDVTTALRLHSNSNKHGQTDRHAVPHSAQGLPKAGDLGDYHYHSQPTYTNAYLQTRSLQLTSLYSNPNANVNLRFNDNPHNSNNNFRMNQDRHLFNSRTEQGSNHQAIRAAKILNFQDNRVQPRLNYQRNRAVQSSNFQNSRAVQSSNCLNKKAIHDPSLQNNRVMHDHNLLNIRPTNQYLYDRNNLIHMDSVNVKRNIAQRNKDSPNHFKHFDNIKRKREKIESQTDDRNSPQLQRTSSGFFNEPNIRPNAGLIRETAIRQPPRRDLRSNADSRTRPNPESFMKPQMGSTVMPNRRPHIEPKLVPGRIPYVTLGLPTVSVDNGEAYRWPADASSSVSSSKVDLAKRLVPDRVDNLISQQTSDGPDNFASRRGLPYQPKFNIPTNVAVRHEPDLPDHSVLSGSRGSSDRKEPTRSMALPSLGSKEAFNGQGNLGQITRTPTFHQPTSDDPGTEFISRPVETSKTLINTPPEEDDDDDEMKPEILWTYRGPNGFSTWSMTFSKCGGEAQSPINIFPHFAIPGDFGAFVFVNYHHVPHETTITNNGHSVQVDMKLQEAPWILGGGLLDKYLMVQYHLHWGYNDLRGSEHTINHVRYPMELHIVHYKASYGSLKVAVRHHDGLAVLAVLFEVSQTDNPAMALIVNLLPNISSPETHVMSDEMYPMVTLLPKDLQLFYRYSGSLTTPTCNEAVIWTVFDQAIPISEYQLNAFRNLLTDRTGFRVKDNFRPTQPLNNRQVYRSTRMPWLRSRGGLNNYNNNNNNNNNLGPDNAIRLDRSVPNNQSGLNHNNNLDPDDVIRFERSIPKSNSSIITAQSTPANVNSTTAQRQRLRHA